MRSAVLIGTILLAGCQKSFDERYADAQKKMNEQAASIDKELGARASEAGTAPVLDPPRDGEGDQPKAGGEGPRPGATP